MNNNSVVSLETFRQETAFGITIPTYVSQLATDLRKDTVEPTIAPSTWADGYGVWHACVRSSGNRSSDAHAARHLIKAELSARGDLGNAPLVVVLDHTTNRGTVVYREQA